MPENTLSPNFFASGHIAAPVTTDTGFAPVDFLQPLTLIDDVGETGQAFEEAPVMTPADTLKMFLGIASGASHPAVMENAFTQALRIQRSMVAATLSNTMPTAMKIKTCEIPVLKLLLEFGGRSPEWRAIVVRLLSENVETGSGHLTVNRAKQVLKELAKQAGVRALAGELVMPVPTERKVAAVILLGWLKNEKAIEPLVDNYSRLGRVEQQEILTVLEAHYQAKLAYFVRWRHHSPQTIHPQIIQLAG